MVRLNLILAIIASSYSYAINQTTIVSFQFAGKLIVVQGEVLGQKGNFILDTGAHGLILNKTYFDTEHGEWLDVNGTNSSSQIFAIKGCNLNIGEQEWRFQPGYIKDLSHLEEGKNLKILGLLGGDLFDRHILTIDMVQRKLEITRLKKKGDREAYLSRQSDLIEVLPLDLKGVIPFFAIQINGNDLSLGLDTGAEVNILDINLYKKYYESGRPMKPRNIRGVNGQIQKTPCLLLEKVKVFSTPLEPMLTTFSSMDNINNYGSSDRIDGLLGFEFLKQLRVGINYKNKELYLFNRNSMVSKAP
jgi:hypothetical protein